MTIWVTLPSLSVGYWSSNTISKIMSVVRKQLYFDRVIPTMENLLCSNFEEVDVGWPLVESVGGNIPRWNLKIVNRG